MSQFLFLMYLKYESCISCTCYPGAALAFNRIYRELREESDLINAYWIELLVHFIRSSSLNVEEQYDDNETSRALQHIRRVLLEKFEFFMNVMITRFVDHIKCLMTSDDCYTT